MSPAGTLVLIAVVAAAGSAGAAEQATVIRGKACVVDGATLVLGETNEVGRCRVGHGVRLHGCHIKSHCLIGIGAVVLDGAVLEENCLVAAGAVVSPGMQVPSGSVLMGAPARVKRQVTEADLDLIRRSAQSYVGLAAEYKILQGP
jgi:carbonic anhydrase/acetyltransferase-like protein (isoleucine patch superfamily)